MRSSSPTGSAHRGSSIDDWNDDGWQEPERPRRDWKKALLVLGLGALSWVATYVGMLELIQSNMGELGLTHKVIVGFSVAMLMTMIIWLLDQMFAPLPLATKLAYVGGYLFLTLISVGFGFGFYWKVLESRSEASRSAESAVTQVKTALFAASARLDQLETTLVQLTQLSSAKAIEERDKGTTCPNSRPGDGPRRRLRDSDAARFSFASQFVSSRAAKAKTDMQSLDADLKLIASADPSTIDPKTGTRNAFLKSLARKLELTATGFNAFRTDPQLRQIRSELADRSSRSVFPMSNGRTFSCPDPQLQSALRGVVRAIDQLPELGKPQIATVEGAQAVVEAFRRLVATFYGVLTFKLPPSADELRALQQKAVASVENAAKRQAAIKVGEGGLAKRDYIPLAIAIFVDLCLLLVSIGRPMNRLNGLIPKMREAERGPVYQILSRFDDIHRDQKIREKFEVFRHVVFDFNGDYYVAVPLDAPRNQNPEQVNELQQEAHLLANLFASFEKEKIFSRVYNPLLTRKTIQKKLWRQGSKFANSQAFRTYRFRDGAWSDIILGAVMGASRRVVLEQQRRAAEIGPELEMPEPQADSAALGPVATEGRVAAVETITPPASAHQTQRSRTVDPRLSERYGPYANAVNESSDDSDDNQPAHPAANGWPYRKPEPSPPEAEVDLHVAANSNTYPDQSNGTAEPDNVIPMPYVRPNANDELEPGPSSPPAMAAVDLQPTPIDEPALRPAMENHANIRLPSTHQEINVRITERTADFSVPVTDAELPQRIGQLVDDKTHSQLRLDFETDEQSRGIGDDPSVLQLESANLAVSRVDDQTDDTQQPTRTDDAIVAEPEMMDDAPIVSEDRPDDAMLQVAKRFAARLPAE